MTLYGDRLYASNANSWFIDVVGNRIVVELIDFSPEAALNFRETVFDSPILDFEESRFPVFLPPYDNEMHGERDEQYSDNFVGIEPLNPLLTVRPGDSIQVFRGGNLVGSLSVGYLAYSGSRRGFVTAAHAGFNQFGSGVRAGDTVHFGGRQIGSIQNTGDHSLDIVDATFVTKPVCDI